MASTKVPLPQDTLYFDANSFDSTGKTVTNDMPRTSAFDFSNATNAPALVLQQNSELYGSVKLLSTMTFSSPTGNIYFLNQNKEITINCDGKS
jgi:hypothetical protein